MAKKTKTSDWKVKIKDVCPCFMSELKKPEPSPEPCTVKCPMEEFKLLLLQREIPSRKEIIKAMIKAGIFQQREIIFALLEIFETIFKSAERRVEEAIQDMKLEGYRVTRDDQNILKAWKELNE